MSSVGATTNLQGHTIVINGVSTLRRATLLQVCTPPVYTRNTRKKWSSHDPRFHPRFGFSFRCDKCILERFSWTTEEFVVSRKDSFDLTGMEPQIIPNKQWVDLSSSIPNNLWIKNPNNTKNKLNDFFHGTVTEFQSHSYQSNCDKKQHVAHTSWVIQTVSCIVAAFQCDNAPSQNGVFGP